MTAAQHAERGKVVALPLVGEDAFQALVQEKSGALLNVAYRIVLSREEARDVLQEAYLKIYRRYRLGKIDPNKLRTYAYQSVVNLSIDRTRRRKPVVSLDSPVYGESDDNMLDYLPATGRDPRAEAAETSDMNRVMYALSRLKPRERSVFALRELEGFSYPEISAVLGMREGTVRTLMLRARRHLQRLLAHYFKDRA